MQSQILRELNVIATNYVNANRKKGTKKLKYQNQLEPKYVTEAKKELSRKNKEISEDQRKELEEFFAKKNDQVKNLEVKKNG